MCMNMKYFMYCSCAFAYLRIECRGERNKGGIKGPLSPLPPSISSRRHGTRPLPLHAHISGLARSERAAARPPRPRLRCHRTVALRAPSEPRVAHPRSQVSRLHARLPGWRARLLPRRHRPCGHRPRHRRRCRLCRCCPRRRRPGSRSAMAASSASHTHSCTLTSTRGRD